MQFWPCISCLLSIGANQAFPMYQLLPNNRPSLPTGPSPYLDTDIAELVKIKLADESRRALVSQRSNKHSHPLPSDHFIEPNQETSITEGDIVVEGQEDKADDEEKTVKYSLGGPSLFAHLPVADMANYSVKRSENLMRIFQG